MSRGRNVDPATHGVLAADLASRVGGGAVASAQQIGRGRRAMKVAGTTVVVTGAGDGIGRELVLGLLARGARVAAVSRSADHLQETADRAGRLADGLSTHVADVSDRAAVEALPAAVLDAHGHVDGL